LNRNVPENFSELLSRFLAVPARAVAPLQGTKTIKGREGPEMASYCILMTLTDQGIRSVKDATQLLKNASKDLEEKGGKLKDFYLTMGHIDGVAVCEAPSDEAILSFVFSLAATGYVRTTTLKAFTAEHVETITRLE
jgi:uncharacterized protein with GYD domain